MSSTSNRAGMTVINGSTMLKLHSYAGWSNKHTVRIDTHEDRQPFYRKLEKASRKRRIK